MKIFNITGMSCAACAARVENSAKKVKGVSSCSVSLLTNSMTVEGSFKEGDVIKAVKDAGYGASLQEDGNISKELEDLNRNDVPSIRNRLISSAIFLLILMYFSMGHMIGLPLPSFLEKNYIVNATIQMILSFVIMLINSKFFISGTKSAIHLSPNMDTLIAMGSAVSFIYSVVKTIMIYTGVGDPMAIYHDLYFESAAMILVFITIGKLLEEIAKGRTTDALKDLMKIAPQKATVLRDGKEIDIPAAEVVVGDIFIVRSGDKVPVDGVITEGSCTINESALTGESLPVEKAVGDTVSASNINNTGYIVCKAERVGQETTFAQVIKLVKDASMSKAPIAKIADKVAAVFVPAVIAIALITFGIWMVLGKDIGFSLSRAISVLVISCPCALGLATPVAVMVGNGKGAKNGILFKTAQAMENAGKISAIAFDKTGTVTKGVPAVSSVYTAEGIIDTDLLTKAYSIEKMSEHPLAKAIVDHCEKADIRSLEVSDLQILPGNGISGIILGKRIYGGNLRFIEQKTKIDEQTRKEISSLSDEGNTPVLFAQDDKLLGVIAIADEIKEDCKEAIRQLNGLGIETVMLTGDNEKTAKAVASKAGIKNILSDLLPQDKEKELKMMTDSEMTAMVGDGINDAPALARADIGIAIGSGTDVAIDTASIVLMKNDLIDVPAAIRLSRKTIRIIHQNLFWAFCYNIIGIPLAAGLFINILGWEMNPMFGAAAMSISSFIVVMNALRINLFNIYDPKNDKKRKRTNKEIKDMEIKMEITGMMCQHCEARVKKALESLPEVKEALVSHETNSATVRLNKEIKADKLKEIVEKEGYTVNSIK